MCLHYTHIIFNEWYHTVSGQCLLKSVALLDYATSALFIKPA